MVLAGEFSDARTLTNSSAMKLRSSRASTSPGGTSEIMKTIIAREVTGLRA